MMDCTRKPAMDVPAAAAELIPRPSLTRRLSRLKGDSVGAFDGLSSPPRRAEDGAGRSRSRAHARARADAPCTKVRRNRVVWQHTVRGIGLLVISKAQMIPETGEAKG